MVKESSEIYKAVNAQYAPDTEKTIGRTHVIFHTVGGPSLVRRFLSYYRPYVGLFTLDFTSAVVLAALELMFPMAVRWIVDTLLPAGNWSMVLWAGAGLFVLYLVTSGLTYVVTYWGHMLGINIEYDMRQQLFDHVQRLSFRYFDNNKTGSIMSRLVHDLFEIGELAHHGPEELFIAVITFLGAAGIMLSMNWQMGIVVLTAAPLLIWLVTVFRKRLETALVTQAEEAAEVNARAENSISGVRVVQAFTNEQLESEKFARNNDIYRQAKLRAYRIMGTSGAAIHFLTRFMSLLVLLVGGRMAILGHITVGELFGFMLITNIFVNSIDRINLMMEVLTKGTAGFRRVVELLDEEPDVEERPDAITAPAFTGNIEFRDVSFGYDNHRRVLSGLDLSIAAGETVALVGPSGAGKTTMASLIPRFYEIDAGAITIDGIDIRDMTLASLRSQIGIVQQDVFLFNDTMRNNIAYGRLDASDDEIREAATRAQLADFIEALPDGYDTVVGERGARLSGGQRQRIAIARMFLKNPPILILDEATSALDTETEMAIQRSLADLAEGRTTLIIAHRLATVRNADRILVVTEDGVVEEGAHNDLMDRNGMYAHLVRSQIFLAGAGTPA